MVKQRPRGMSLMSALLLITIVIMVAATMAGVFTLNMNITQRVSNGNVALSEAEAGISEVLYQITRDENVSDTENAQQNPIVTWGQNGETVRKTITPGMSEGEAYHVVTFDSGSSFPHSTNNTDLAHDSGSMGRTVPDGKIHIVSTGYCKGQYRTVECLVERPPFPFGLAASGPIDSRDPITVKGTSSIATLQSGDADRPGHILCNSAEGITIGPPPDGVDTKTEISGFVKSSGPVNIAQPAVIRGGIRSNADTSTLADIDLEDFNIVGEPGVINLLDSRYDEEQEMDVMYHYSGGHLQFMRTVNLVNAMIFVNGDLTVHGPLTGEGLIVVTGNATFKSGTALAGSNKMAILSGGDITLEGNNNYFSGLVYAEGNLNASNITIVGNTIVNSSDPSRGRADLENVTIVSNEETGDMTVTITSSTQAQGSNNVGEGVPPLSLNGNNWGFPGPGDANGYLSPEDAHKLDDLADTMFASLWSGAQDTSGAFPGWTGRPADVGSAGHLWDAFESLYEQGEALRAAQEDYESALSTYEGMDEDDDGYDDAQQALTDAQNALDALTGQQDQFQADVRQLVQDVFDHVASHTDEHNTFTDGLASMDIEKDIRFNLNEYLPESEKIKVSFWKVYPRRM